MLFQGSFGVSTAIAIALLIAMVYLLVRKNPYDDNARLNQKVSV